jgi:hypothetical protein
MSVEVKDQMEERVHTNRISFDEAEGNIFKEATSRNILL